MAHKRKVSERKIVQFYDDTARQALGIIMAGVVTGVVKWHGDRRATIAARNQENISIHDTVTECKNNLARIDDWIKGFEVAAQDLIAKFETTGAVDKYDVEALKRELKQKPDLGNNGEK